jgi:hypothetical protein
MRHPRQVMGLAARSSRRLNRRPTCRVDYARSSRSETSSLRVQEFGAECIGTDVCDPDELSELRASTRRYVPWPKSFRELGHDGCVGLVHCLENFVIGYGAAVPQRVPS